MSKMKMLRMYRAITILFILTLSGCGNIQTTAVGFDEPARLIVRGYDLVGSRIEINGSFIKNITREDLARRSAKKQSVGVFGVKGSENEKMKAIVLLVDNGLNVLKVTKGGETLLVDEIYISKGQQKEVVIR